jgi:hypothetical protein
MGTGIARFVEVDDTAADVRLQFTLQRSASAGNWCKMAGTDEKFIVVLQKKSAKVSDLRGVALTGQNSRPLGGIDRRRRSLRLDGIVLGFLLEYESHSNSWW